MTQGNAVSENVAFVLGLLEDIQLLSFAFRPEAGFGYMPWWMPYLFNPLSYKPESNNGSTVLFYVAFIFLVFNNVVMAQVGISLNSNKMQAIWPLHLLRFITKLKTTVFLIPIYEIMIYGLVCHDAHTGLRYMFVNPSQCKSFLHTVIPGAIGVAYLTLKAPIVISVFFRINPAEQSHSSKTTGRVDVVYTYMRFILSIILEFTAENGPAAIITAITLISFIMVFLISRYQPMFQSRFNDIRAGIFALSFWSGIQAGICYAYGGYSSPIGFAMLCIWLVPAFISGYMASSITRTIICRGVYRRMKARQEQLSEEGGLSGSLRSKQVKLTAVMASDGETGKGGSRDYFINKLDDIVGKVTVEPVKVFRSYADVEIACRFLQRNKDPEAWGLANSIFDAGIEQYPDLSSLPLMKCHYMADFEVGDPSHLWECLDLAKSSRPPFDIRFFIFFEERAMEQEDRKEDLAASHLNITGYTEVIAMERSVRKYHLETVLALKALWEYLKSDKVAPDCIPYLLARVDANRSNAKKVYEAMLNKYPNSKQVLRRYSAFLLTVENDVEEATKLLNRAEDIENAEARELSSRPVDIRPDPAMQRDFENFRFGGDMEMIREMSHGDPAGGTSASHSMDGMRVSDDILNVDAIPPEEANVNGDRGERDNTLRRRTSNAVFVPQPEFKLTDGLGPGGVGDYANSDDGASRQLSILDRKKSLGFAGEVNLQESMPSIAQRLEEARKKDKAWRSGPGSQSGSQTSATSSQKDARQIRLVRNLMETRLLGPINRFNILMNIATVLLLTVLIAGCCLTVLTFGQILQAVNEAFTRMRPRATLIRMTMYMRMILLAGSAGSAGTMPMSHARDIITSSLQLFSGALYGNIQATTLPLLFKYNLNDQPSYWLRVFRNPTLSLKHLNPYFLMELLYNSGVAVVQWPPDAFFTVQTQLATEIRIWVDNILEVSKAFEDMAAQGGSDFLISNTRTMNICYGLVGATIGISLLVGLVLFRPILAQTRKREIQILSLVHTLPRKYINERVDALEVEVENIMEEMEDETEGMKSSKSSIGIPSENVMRDHTTRRLTKSQTAATVINTIDTLTDRLYGVSGTAALALEMIAQDQNSWKPQEPKLWFEEYLLTYDEAHTQLIMQTDGGFSIYNFPSAGQYERAHPLCHLVDPNGCDPSVRTYNYSIGYNENLTTSSMENIYARWHEAAEGFRNDPPAAQTFDSPRIPFITGLLEDITQATQAENDLLVQDVSNGSASARSLNIFLFVLALAVLLISYVFVFRNVVWTLRNEMLNICKLYLSLPPGLIQSVPELKRFVDSGGAVMPTLLQQKK
ncbi:hypothetical protein HDV00_002176 [Rhizophlyctis rosea]|nr:hypothetical protein HDV00_002176 [Rhizophlyctis rosea]